VYETLTVAAMACLTLPNISVNNDLGFVPVVVIIFQFRFVTRVMLRVPPVEQELHTRTLQEHTRSPPVYSGVRVAQSLVCCVMFCVLLCLLFLLVIVVSALQCTASH
jgi:hypothetical protein